MKYYVYYLAVTFLWSSLIKAGQLLTSYNLIATPQLVVPQTSGYGLADPGYYSSIMPQPQRVLPNPTVLANSAEEASVPRSLKKSSNFYDNPYIASALAKESLTFNKESVVYDRPSEKIDRNEIFKLINSLHRVHHE